MRITTDFGLLDFIHEKGHFRGQNSIKPVFVHRIGGFCGQNSSGGVLREGMEQLGAVTLTFPDDPDPLTRGAKCEK